MTPFFMLYLGNKNYETMGLSDKFKGGIVADEPSKEVVLSDGEKVITKEYTCNDSLKVKKIHLIGKNYQKKISQLNYLYRKVNTLRKDVEKVYPNYKIPIYTSLQDEFNYLKKFNITFRKKGYIKRLKKENNYRKSMLGFLSLLKKTTSSTQMTEADLCF